MIQIQRGCVRIWFLIRYALWQGLLALKPSTVRFPRIYDTDAYFELVRDWREREGPVPVGDRSFYDLAAAVAMHKRLRSGWTHVGDEIQFDKKDHWAESALSLASMKGDCEDFAIIMFRQLREMGFHKDRVCLIIVKGHACCGLYMGDDFTVFDNGYMSLVPVLASKLFPLNKKGLTLVPLHGFDSERSWSYT